MNAAEILAVSFHLMDGSSLALLDAEPDSSLALFDAEPLNWSYDGDDSPSRVRQCFSKRF